MTSCKSIFHIDTLPDFLPLQGHQGSHRVEICRPALCPVDISDISTLSFQPFQPGRNWRVGAGISESVAAWKTGTPRFVAFFCDICSWDRTCWTFVASVASLARRSIDMLRDPNFVLVSTPEYASDPEFTQLDICSDLFLQPAVVDFSGEGCSTFCTKRFGSTLRCCPR